MTPVLVVLKRNVSNVGLPRVLHRKIFKTTKYINHPNQHDMTRCRKSLRFLSSHTDVALSKSINNDTNEGYNLTKRQMRALELMTDKQGKASVDKEFDLLRETLTTMKEQSLIQEESNFERNPWFSLLSYPSRALWRTSANLSSKSLTKTQLSIIRKSERTTKQLRRTYDNVISNHQLLSQRRERERRLLANGEHKESLDTFGSKKQNTADKAVKPVYYKPEYTICSLKYRLIPNYIITKRVLSEAQSLLGRKMFLPKRIVDIGVGVGSASASALDYFHHDAVKHNNKEHDIGYRGVEWVHGVDPSQSMQDAAKLVLEGVVKENCNDAVDTKPRLTFGAQLTASANIQQISGSGTFDLALCTYTLMELPSIVSALSVAAITWEKLRPNGVAIFIEPGTPDGFNALRSVRNMLLDCCPPFDTVEGNEDDSYIRMKGDEECHVIAPCTHNGKCPMQRHKTSFSNEEQTELDDDEDIFNVPDEYLNNNKDEYGELNSLEEEEPLVQKSSFTKTNVFDSSFCSFVHTMPGGTRRKQGEKFSYLVVQKRITGNDGDSDEKDNDLNSKNKDDQQNSFQDVELVELLSKSLDSSSKEGTKNVSLLKQAMEIEDKFLESDSDPLGLELVCGDEHRKSWGRIIRAPIKKKGHVILDYCGSDSSSSGRIIRHTVSRGESARTAPGAYGGARKARWGGLWPDVKKHSDK